MAAPIPTKKRRGAEDGDEDPPARCLRIDEARADPAHDPNGGGRTRARQARPRKPQTPRVLRQSSTLQPQ
jgi:hypothetical protein